jgi:hypothetical protein
MAKKKTIPTEPVVEEPVVEPVNNEEDGDIRTRLIILETSIFDTELGSFKPGDKYPCDEKSANRMIERKLARAID